MTTPEHEVAKKHLGYPGAMIGSSKSAYRAQYPDHQAIFNGNVCVKSSGKIWYGDLDVTDSREKLKALARELKEDVFVLREMDARFEYEDKPRFEHAAFVISAD